MNSVAARSSTRPYKLKKTQTKTKPRNFTQVLNITVKLIITVKDVHHVQVYILTLKTLTVIKVCAHTHK